MLHIAPVDVDLSVRKVPPAAGHQAAQVVLVQVRDDNRVELVAADSACGERVWQLAGLPERASGTGVDQDATLASLTRYWLNTKRMPVGLAANWARASTCSAVRPGK